MVCGRRSLPLRVQHLGCRLAGSAFNDLVRTSRTSRTLPSSPLQAFTLAVATATAVIVTSGVIADNCACCNTPVVPHARTVNSDPNACMLRCVIRLCHPLRYSEQCVHTVDTVSVTIVYAHCHSIMLPLRTAAINDIKVELHATDQEIPLSCIPPFLRCDVMP